MNIDQFGQGVEILKNVYGEKAYPRERIASLYKSFMGVDYLFWLKAVDHAINNNRFTPLEKELYESVNEVLLKEGVQNKNKTSLDNYSGCDACDHLGWFYIKTIPETRKYMKATVACSCLKGQFVARTGRIPEWALFKNKSLFYTLPGNAFGEK